MHESIEIASVFLGLTMLIGVPIAVVVWTPLFALLGRALIRIREKELDLKRAEMVLRARRRGRTAIPEYVDLEDPEAILAWTKTELEMM